MASAAKEEAIGPVPRLPHVNGAHGRPDTTASPRDWVSRDLQLLLWCTQNNLDSKHIGSLRDLLLTRPNWGRLVVLSRSHGVLPLVYSSLRQHGAGLVPEHVTSRLRSGFLDNAASTLLQAEELVAISQLLSEARIRVIAVKGPALAMAAYGALSLRTQRDLDILVDRGDVSAATELLVRRGYELSDQPANRRGRISYRTEKDLTLFRRDLGVTVELHWALARPAFRFGLAFDDLWRRSGTRLILGTEITTPHPEDQLLILCAHGASHCWASLKWICDLAGLIRCEPIDWRRLLGRARALGAERMLLWGLALARDLYDVQLPDLIQENIDAQRVVNQLSIQTRQEIFQPDRRKAEVERVMRCLPARERVRDRAVILLHLISAHLRPTARDYKIRPLPPHLWWLYYVLRPLRLARADGSALLRPLLGRLSGR